MPDGPSPSFDVGGVPCWLVLEDPHGAIGEAWPPDGPAADALFKCPWYDRYTVAQTLVGFGRGTPAWPWPGSPNIRCLSLGRIVGSGRPRTLQVPRGETPNIIPAGWVEYDHAIIPANFGVLPYGTGEPGNPVTDPSGQPWTTTRFRFSGEVLTPPNNTFVYVGGALAGVPVSNSLVGITRPKLEISLTRHKVDAAFDMLALSNLIGRVNTATFTIGNYGFPEGYVLFGGFSANEQRDSLGNITYEFEYGLLCNFDASWNSVMAKDAEFHLLNTKEDESGNYPFEYVDFTTIP
jgi:hypothetical protein